MVISDVKEECLKTKIKFKLNAWNFVTKALLLE